MPLNPWRVSRRLLSKRPKSNPQRRAAESPASKPDPHARVSPVRDQAYVSPFPTDQSLPYIPFGCCKPGLHHGILVRNSHRWYRFWHTKSLVCPVPYIDNVGKFSIHQLGVWKTPPETWFASVTATINNRLLKLYQDRARKRFIKKSDQNLIFRISAWYAYSHDTYRYDRLLANLRPSRLQVCKSLLNYYVSKLGETFRFVYSQANFQALWFSFRSKWIRDKPKQRLFELLDKSPLTFKRKNKFQFFDGNPFLSTLNWLVVHRGGNPIKLT
jgi:hypothetical protein